MKPQRIKLSRRKGWRKPENTVVVSRPSKWGNPWKVGARIMTEVAWLEEPGMTLVREFVITPELAVELYRQAYVWDVDEARAELAGKNLACWCRLDRPCHADVLLEIANGGAS